MPGPRNMPLNSRLWGLLWTVALLSSAPVLAEEVAAAGAGLALRLDGVSGYVEVSADSSLFMADSRFTLEAWARIGARFKGSTNFPSLGTEQYGFTLTDSGLETCCYDAPPRTVRPLVQNRWYHLAYVSTGKDQPHRLFVDGVLEQELPAVTRYRDIFPRPLYLGNKDLNRGLIGELDEVRVWNRPLSQEEIRAKMNTGLTGQEEGLRAYYTFDALGAAGRVPDLSGHNNHGQLIGTVDFVPSAALVNTGLAGPRLQLNPQALEVGWKPQTTFIALSNAGIGPLDWRVEEQADWLDISWVRGSNAGSGILEDGGEATLAIYTSGRGLAPGVHETRIKIHSSGGDAELPVRLTRGPEPLPVLVPAEGPGQALRLGTGAVEVPVSAGLQGLVEFTAEAWIMPLEYTLDAGLFTLGTPASERFTVVLAGSATGLYLQSNWIPEQPYPFHTTSFSTPIFDRIFQHLALTVKGNQSRLYLNGALAEERECGPLLRADPAHQLIIGRQPHRRDPYFKGVMDEFRLWDRARTEEELRVDMNLSLRGDEDHLLVYYTFDGDPGATEVRDLSGNGNHGQLIGPGTGAWLVESAAPVNMKTPRPILAVDSVSIAVGAQPQTTEVLLNNAGAGTLEWTAAEGVSWLWVQTPSGDTRGTGAVSGQGRAVLQVHTVGLGLPKGLHETAIEINSNGGRAQLAVQIQVESEPPLSAAEDRVTPEAAPAIPWPAAFPLPVAEVLRVSAADAEQRVRQQVGGAQIEHFRFVATSPTGLLYAAVDPWQDSTWPNRGRQYGTHLLRSADGGQTWETLVRGIPPSYCTYQMPLYQVIADPQHPDHAFIATGDGFFRDRAALPLPPQARAVTALAFDPHDPSRFYLATGRVVATCEYEERALSLPGLFRGTLDSAGRFAWEDLTTGLVPAVAPVDSLAVDPNDSLVLYLRSAAGAVFRRRLEEKSQEGWEPVTLGDIPSYVSLTPSAGQIEPFLRVPPGYAEGYVPRDSDLHYSFSGFLYGRDGVLYSGFSGLFSHMISRGVQRSIDGGVSWQGVWGGGSFFFEPWVHVWDGRDFLYVTGRSLTGEPAAGVGPWALDPVDPLCLYVAQQGRGQLFRTLDSGKSWEKVPTSFSPNLVISGIGVDSLSAIYVKTGNGYFRRSQTPRPVHLTTVDAWPDTLMPGQPLTVRAQLKVRGAALPPGRMVVEYKGQTALRDDGLEGDARAGDGLYTGQLAAPPDAQVGFYRVPVWFEVDGQPLARASTVGRFMIGPKETVDVYQDGPGRDWRTTSVSGQVDLQSRTQVHGGSFSCALDGTMAFQYANKPLHPFGYVLIFYLYDPVGRTSLQIEDTHVPGVEAGQWTQVEVPAERLHNSPEVSFWGEVGPALLRQLRIASQGLVYIDDVQLRPLWPSPLQAAWESEIPDSVIAGVPFRLGGVLRLTHYDEAGEPPQVAADLSALGGPAALPLVPEGDGIYRLNTVLADTALGHRNVLIVVRQQTARGVFDVSFTDSVMALPAADRVIYQDGFDPLWQQGNVFNATVIPEAQEQVYEGSKALKVVASGFTVILNAIPPAPSRGYRALRFAFHPGDAAGSRSTRPSLSVKANDHTLSLTSPAADGNAMINFDRREWQVIEVPFTQWRVPESEDLHALTFFGNLRGTFYLDDIRLVAVRPSVLPPTLVAETRDAALPQAFRLDPNYPNPFNSNTTFRFALPASAQAELALYNLAGQKVVTLLSGLREAGTYTLQWDGRDEQGRELASGVYLCRLQAGMQVETRKLLLLR